MSPWTVQHRHIDALLHERVAVAALVDRAVRQEVDAEADGVSIEFWVIVL